MLMTRTTPQGLPKDSFRYVMEEVDESTSQSGISEAAIVDFPNSPHLYNKKAYAFQSGQR